MKPIFIFLIALVFSIGLNGSTLSAQEEKIAVKKVAYVAVAVLNYRDKPSVEGKRLGSFVLGDSGIVTEKSAHQEEVAGKSSYWYHLKSGAKQGWVFGAFLSSEKVQNKAGMIAMMKGVYYYSNVHGGMSEFKDVLHINGDQYDAKRFSSSTGGYYIYKGTVTYQANDIILSPETATYTASNWELSTYGKGYANSGIPRKLNEEEKREWSTIYLIKKCDTNLYLIMKSECDDVCPCDAIGWAFVKK